MKLNFYDWSVCALVFLIGFIIGEKISTFDFFIVGIAIVLIWYCGHQSAKIEKKE